MTRIGIAIVEQNGRVLVGVRNSQAVLGGMHEFPGGKCHADESPAECAVRECFEETGLRIDVVELLNHTRHTYDHGELDLAFFLCRPAAESAQPQNGFTWTGINELPQLNFPSGNRAAIDTLLNRHNRGGRNSDYA